MSSWLPAVLTVHAATGAEGSPERHFLELPVCIAVRGGCRAHQAAHLPRQYSASWHDTQGV